jgi:uncharacterized protein (TIGR03435 family)
MTKTKTIVLAGVVALVAVAAAVAAKMIFFPSVDDKYFQIGPVRLRQAPANVVIVRPTHFASSARRSSPQNQTDSVDFRGVRRMVGINMSFQYLMATAYGGSPGRIVLPAGAPKGDYDYLVTVTKDPEARLQAAIQKKLGYTAQKEMRDTDVLALKVENPNSDGLKVSRDGEKDGLAARDGRLYFTHQRLTTITSSLEGILKTPFVDKTGLTNFYNFSLVWDPQTQQMIQAGTLDTETGKKILAEWGLGLEPDTASMEMLVVKKAK